MRNTIKTTRRITAITLSAALAVAVYLNWQYATVGAGIENSGDILEVSAAPTQGGENAPPAQVMDGLPTEQEALSSANKNYGEAQLVSASADSGRQFFEQARLNRTKTRDEMMDSAQKSLKGTSLTPEERTACTERLTACLEKLTLENEVETLVRAKGFADCLCFLQEGRADLTVMTAGEALNAAQVAQIRDIVLSRCDITAQNITVVEVQ